MINVVGFIDTIAYLDNATYNLYHVLPGKHPLLQRYVKPEPFIKLVATDLAQVIAAVIE